MDCRTVCSISRFEGKTGGQRLLLEQARIFWVNNLEGKSIVWLLLQQAINLSYNIHLSYFLNIYFITQYSTHSKIIIIQTPKFHPTLPMQAQIPPYLTPDWQEATQHALASKIGFPPDSSSAGSISICPCCYEHINKTQISLFENTKELEFLGFGFPLYFSFVRNCVMLLFLSVCSYNLIALYHVVEANGQLCTAAGHPLGHQGQVDPGTVSQIWPGGAKHFMLRKYDHQLNEAPVAEGPSSSGHKTVQCTSWMIQLANVDKTTTQTQEIIRFSSFFIHAFMLIYIREKLLKYKQYFDERRISLSDYSVTVANLRQEKGQKNTIRKILEKQYGVKEIAQILLVPHLSDYQVLNKKKRQVMEKLKGRIEKGQLQKIVELDKQVAKLDKDLREIIVKAKMQYVADRLITQKAIVIVNTEEEKDMLLQKFEKKKTTHPGWQRTLIMEAPEPKEIIWENAGLSQSSKKYYIALGWTLSILLLIFLTLLFLEMSKYKSNLVMQKISEYQNDKQNNSLLTQAKIFVYGMIFLVIVLNKLVISNFFHYFTELERHSTTCNFQFSFCLKYCLGLFFTTALMTFLVEGLLIGNYYSHDYGLIQQETIMFIFICVFSPTLWALHPHYLFKIYQRSRKYGKNGLTQKEANEIMEDPEYDLGKRYAEVIKMMWISFLYMTLIPIGSVISCVGLGLYYWVDKYNLLRRSTIRSNVSGDMVSLTFRLLDLTLVLRVIGQILLDQQIRQRVQVSSYVLFLLAVIFQFTPFDRLIEFFNHEKFLPAHKTYMEVKHEFLISYYNNHLLFSKLAEDRLNIANFVNTNYNLGRNPNKGNLY